MIIRRKNNNIIGANSVQSVDVPGDFSEKFQKLLGVEPAEPRQNKQKIIIKLSRNSSF